MPDAMFRIFAVYKNEQDAFTFDNSEDANKACSILRAAGFDVTDYHEYQLCRLDGFEMRASEIKKEIDEFLEKEQSLAC